MYRRQRSIYFVLMLVLVASLFTGSVSATDSKGPKKGYLIIVGGGKITDDIAERFVTLAGGKDAKVVVIPTASEDKDLDLDKIKKAFFDRFGMANVTMLHTRDKKVQTPQNSPSRSARRRQCGSPADASGGLPTHTWALRSNAKSRHC